MAADPAYRNAIANSDRQNARIEHDRALRTVMLEPADHTELYRQFSDNESLPALVAGDRLPTDVRPETSERRCSRRDLTHRPTDRTPPPRAGGNEGRPYTMRVTRRALGGGTGR